MRGRPLLAEVVGAPYNAFGQFIEVRRPVGAVQGGTVSWNVHRTQFVEDGIHGAVGLTQEDAAPHASKSPSEALEHLLSFQIIAELFAADVPDPVAFRSHA